MEPLSDGDHAQLQKLLAVSLEKPKLAKYLPEARENIKFLAWFISAAIMGLLGAAGYYFHTEGRLADHDRRLADHDTIFSEYRKLKDKRDAQWDAQNALNTAAGNQNKLMADRLDTLATLLHQIEPRTNEMWFMKEHGISNKEDFQQKHGYSAPDAGQLSGGDHHE